MDAVRIVGYRPGALGRITELHALYYSRHWKFGLFFERKVAREMADFLGRFDESRDGVWLAEDGDRIVGSVFIDGAHAQDQGAHLRWYIVDPSYQGRGIGRSLLLSALDFCRRCGYRKAFLWTFAGLDAARHLYEEQGFRMIREQEEGLWGVTVKEQLFEWRP